MTRSKILIFLLLYFPVSGGLAQELIFRQPDPASDVFRMKVNRNDKVLIAEDSAYIYSAGMVLRIRELEKRYLISLADREMDLQHIKMLLATIQDNYSSVNELLNKSTSLNKEQLEKYQEQISIIISNLEKDITSLHQLEDDIARAQAELDSVKKAVIRERHRLWWKKTGGIFIGVIAGFAAGFIIGAS